MQEYLTENEIAKIEVFCKDEVLFGAVKKVILQALYTHGTVQKGMDINPKRNGAFSLVALALTNPIPDEELGKHIRGMWAGVNILENALNDLQTIRSDKGEEVESPYDQAE